MHDDPTRTTPTGMVRYAHEFLESALAVNEKIGKRREYRTVAPIPALYLIGHSIELTLKAFLLSQEVDLKQIKKLGHNLHDALRKAKELGLLEYVKFNAVEEGAFDLLNELYKTKQLEYIVTGFKTVPTFVLIESFSVKLFNAVSVNLEYNKQVDGSIVNFE